MAEAKSSIKDERANALFDYAVKHPEGFTRYDIERDFGWGNVSFYAIARRVRTTLADDTITLVCEPRGATEAWLYRLVGDLDGAKPWVERRTKDVESRVLSTAAVAKTLVNATDGRSHDGRKARLIARHLTRLEEDLEALNEQFVA